MEFLQDSFQKFFSIADELTEDIRNGLFPYGKPFLSRSEICDRFSISLKTAHKVQKELCKRGMIAANRGRAFSVCDPNKRGVVPLHEIRLLRQNQPFCTDYVMDELASGIQQVCESENIRFSEIFLELQDKNHHKINAAGGSDPGQGIVLLPYRSIMCRGAGYFLKYWQPYRVTVDFPLPGTSGVMLDEADVVKSVFEDAAGRGAGTVMQIPHNLNAWSNIFNHQCFRFGEFYSKMLGIEQLVSLEPEISMMVKEIKRLRPDALFFHSDLKRNLDQILNEIEYQPMLYFVCRGEGDDVTLSNVPGARRYIFNYTDIGRAAAELLLKADYKYAKRELVYVKGRLV